MSNWERETYDIREYVAELNDYEAITPATIILLCESDCAGVEGAGWAKGRDWKGVKGCRASGNGIRLQVCGGDG